MGWSKSQDSYQETSRVLQPNSPRTYAVSIFTGIVLVEKEIGGVLYVEV